MGRIEIPKRVVMLLYPQVASVDVCGPLEPFGLANFLTGRQLYKPATASMDGMPVTVAGGFLKIEPTYDCASLPERIDLLLVAGGPGYVAAARDPRLLAWLRALEPRCVRMGAVCTGSTVLAASGLIAGHRVASHWLEALRLLEEHRDIEIDADAIFLNSGKYWTSAGMLAGVDLALALIEADHGRQLALDLARFLVLERRRSGGQSQFSAQLRTDFIEDPRIRRVQIHIYEHPEADLSVKVLSRRAAMSERSLLRLFKKITRLTLGSYVQEVRLGHARDLLERTGLDTQAIATRSGLGSATNLRRVFQRRLGVSPSSYRQSFGARRSPTQPPPALRDQGLGMDLAHVTSGKAVW